jgi:hypothetical protein
VLVAACRFDPDRSHERITDRDWRNDRRQQYLAKTICRPRDT